MKRAAPASDTAALVLIAIFSAGRVALAAMLGLGVDEAYTLSVAHDLNLSYYDHPPLQYWIAHFFMPVLGDGRAARLPFIAMFALSSWLLYRLTQRLFDQASAMAALVALNCSAFFTFAGGWVLPDGPLMLALLAAAVVLARHFFAPEGSPSSNRTSWLAAGFWVGVAGLSKYHALLFALGLLLFIAGDPRYRRELRTGAPWLGALLAVAMSLPVLVWNARHGWISFLYQGGRARLAAVSHPEYLLANIIGQALWMLPWIFLPMLAATWRAYRAGPDAPRSWFCLCLGLPTIMVFTLTPLWGGLGLPHWQMPGWLMLYPVLGEYVARAFEPARLRRFGIACVALVAVIGSVLLAQALTGYGRVLAPGLFVHGDPTLDAFEWNELPAALRARGLLQPGVFLITTHWIWAGRIDQSLHDAVPVVIVGGNPKQFGLRYDPAQFLGRDALLIAPVEQMPDLIRHLEPYFESLQALTPLALGRSGMAEIPLGVMRAHRLRTTLPVAPKPQP
ncbi:MAG: glycosyltransferase family 39 protein [Gammaproteobacteria bacterium]|nr:glycosyltransferase family 39 protein [Gammaproteobacteria bacterium]